MQGAQWLRELWTIALERERSTDPVIWWTRPAVRASEKRGSSHERSLVEAERERGCSRVDLSSTDHQPWRRFERDRLPRWMQILNSQVGALWRWKKTFHRKTIAETFAPRPPVAMPGGAVLRKKHQETSFPKQGLTSSHDPTKALRRKDFLNIFNLSQRLLRANNTTAKSCTEL
jgi:hypothetical protein